MIKKKNYSWILLARHLSGECDMDEYIEFRKTITDNPDFKATANALNNIWNSIIIPNNKSLQESWERHIKRMNEKGIKF